MLEGKLKSLGSILYLPLDSKLNFTNNRTLYRVVGGTLRGLFGQNVSFRFGKKFFFKLGHFQKFIFPTWRFSKESRLFLKVPWTWEIHFRKNLCVWAIWD